MRLLWPIEKLGEPKADTDNDVRSHCPCDLDRKLVDKAPIYKPKPPSLTFSKMTGMALLDFKAVAIDVLLSTIRDLMKRFMWLLRYRRICMLTIGNVNITRSFFSNSAATMVIFFQDLRMRA